MRCLVAGLLLRAAAGFAAAQLCDWAANHPQAHPARATAALWVCEWAETELGCRWRLGHLLWLLLFLRWCYNHFCAHLEHFVDMPRLMPAEYEPPPNGISLASLR